MMTHHFSLGLIVLLALLGAVGCSSTGNEALHQENETTVQAKLVEGKTTKAEVKTLFGSPTTVSFTDGGLEIWNYELSKMHEDVVNYIPIVSMLGSSKSGTKKMLVILFDDQSIVKKYTLSETPISIKTGLFSKG